MSDDVIIFFGCFGYLHIIAVFNQHWFNELVWIFVIRFFVQSICTDVVFLFYIFDRKVVTCKFYNHRIYFGLNCFVSKKSINLLWSICTNILCFVFLCQMSLMFQCYYHCKYFFIPCGVICFSWGQFL